MNRRPLLLAAIFAAFAAAALAAVGGAPTPDSVALHARKNFGLSPLWKVSVSPLKSGDIPGFLQGTMTIEAPQGKQEQAIWVSENGRWYFMGDPNDLSIDPDEDRVSKMKLAGVPSIGPDDAPLTLVEYSDLQCPHCKRSHDILKENLGAYKGKVRRIFKNYPLTHIHPWAMPGALALACASKIAPRKAAAYKAAVFDAQGEIPASDVPAAVERLKAIAVQSGYARDRFSKGLDSGDSKPLVDADIAEGDRVGVRGTPSLFVNGRKVRGYEWPEVKAVLDAKLAGR